MKKIRKILVTPTLLFLFILMLIILFGFDSTLMDSGATYANIVVPYINVNITIITAIVTIVCLIFIILNKKFKFDEISIYLLFRCLIYFIPIIYIHNGNFKFGIAFAIIETLFAYIIGRDYTDKIDYIAYLLEIFIIIAGGQVFYTLYVNKLSFFSSDLKWYMVTPVGRYNYITCMILPSFYFLNSYCELKGYRKLMIFNFFFCFFSILGTGSKLALILFFGYAILETFNRLNKKIKLKNIFQLLVIFLIFILFFNIVETGFVKIINKYTQKNIFENRLKVYDEGISLFLENWLLGRSAYSYKIFDSSKAHNFVLESLIQSGVIGTYIYLLVLIKVILITNQISDELYKKCLKSFLIGYLIQGLIEPNLFGVTSDAFFWIFCGISISMFKEGTKKKENK